MQRLLVVVVNDWWRSGGWKPIVKALDLCDERSLQYHSTFLVALRLLCSKLVDPAELCITRLA